jgi:hypothetical protein
MTANAIAAPAKRAVRLATGTDRPRFAGFWALRFVRRHRCRASRVLIVVAQHSNLVLRPEPGGSDG